MKRIFRTFLLSLAVFSCSQPTEHQATDADRRLWHSYLERAELHPDSLQWLTDSALLLARTHGMSDTGYYRPFELKSLAERKAGRYNESRVWLDSMLVLAQAAGHNAVQVRALNGIALLLLQSPDWMQAELPLRNAMEIVDSSDLTGEKPFVLYNWSSWLRSNRNLAAAVDTLKLAADLFRAAGNRRFLGHVYQAKGELQLDLKDSLSAEADLDRSLVEYGATGDTFYMSRSYYSLSSILLARNTDSAHQYFNAAIQSDTSHQFPYAYLAGLMLFAQHYLDAGLREKAIPYLDSAVRFATYRKNQTDTPNAWLQSGVARLHQQYHRELLSNSPSRRRPEGVLKKGQSGHTKSNISVKWEQFKKNGAQKLAGLKDFWIDLKHSITGGEFSDAKPKQGTVFSPSWLATIQTQYWIWVAIAATSVFLVMLVIGRLRLMRRNRAFTAYREQAEKLAAGRTYRRDTIAGATQDENTDGAQLVIDREKRILALEMIFMREKLHLDPNLNFSDVCDRLSESEVPFRAVVKKMYDIEFEEWLDFVRVEEAIHAIMRGDQLKTIHNACGFASAARFRRVFQKVTGLPPSRYKKWPKPRIR